ncbi:hypothetical protein BDY24DRAFT_383633 [Mrakia frigida]|uniref:uncharacterized protein n=1 Tax=Mrakia frigida TaxID=29902 RepID=UPI003FCBF9A4
MPPSSPLNPYTHHPLSSPTSPSLPPRQHQEDVLSRRRSFFKHQPSTRSSSSSPSSSTHGSPSLNHPPTTVSDALWRDRFKKKCDDRVLRDKKERERERARRRRNSLDRSSDTNGEDDDMRMDQEEEDGDGEEEEDEGEKEIFARIIRSQQRKYYERSSLAEPLHRTGDLDRLLEEEEQDEPPLGMEYDDDEEEPPPLEPEIDPEYLEYLLSQRSQIEPDDDPQPSSSSSSPPLQPPACPACPSHPPLSITPQGGLVCSSCSSSLAPATAAQIDLAWNVEGAHSGRDEPLSHQLVLVLLTSEDGETALEARCVGEGCAWARAVEI